MAVTVTERHAGRRQSGDTAERAYTIRGTSSDSTALSSMLSVAPTSVSGIPRDRGQCAVEEITDLHDGAWIGFARYQAQRGSGGNLDSVGDELLQFDTTGGSEHIQFSKATVDTAGAARNHHGAIGVHPDGTIEGLDIVVPQFAFSRSKVLAAAAVDFATISAIYALTGRVNNATFYNFAAGEVLFLGASGTRRGNQDWEMMFRFAASPNAAGLAVGSGSGLTVNKGGWQYLWAEVRRAVNSGRFETRITAAYVERVYDFGNFGALPL